MLGLAVLLVLVGYLLISVLIVRRLVRYAQTHGKNFKHWGWTGVLVMYLIPFWDWLPTVAVHQYACATEAGFWVYKTPEQWKKENPGVAETLVVYKGGVSEKDGDMVNYTNTYFLNSRFNWVVKRNGKFLFNRWRHEQTVVDIKNKEVLARYVDFSTSEIPPKAGWDGWKFWLKKEHCQTGEYRQDALREFRNEFKRIEK